MHWRGSQHTEWHLQLCRHARSSQAVILVHRSVASHDLLGCSADLGILDSALLCEPALVCPMAAVTEGQKASQQHGRFSIRVHMQLLPACTQPASLLCTQYSCDPMQPPRAGACSLVSEVDLAIHPQQHPAALHPPSGIALSSTGPVLEDECSPNELDRTPAGHAKEVAQLPETRRSLTGAVA